MKRFLAGFTLVFGLFVLHGQAMAEQVGLYVAPKLIYGHAAIKKHNGNMTEYDNSTGATRTTFSAGFGSDNDSLFGGALAIGYNFNKRFNIPIRTELEYSMFSEAEAKGSRSTTYPIGIVETTSLKQKFDIQTLFVNAYYDFKTGTQLTPYIGGGLGVAFVNSKTSGTLGVVFPLALGGLNDSIGSSSSRKMNSNFAWNIGAGIGWDINEQWTLDLGYRFVGLGKVKSNTATYITPDQTGRFEFNSKVDNLYMHQVALGVRFSF